MRIFILLFMLAPLFLWGQYPDNPRKLRLGYQTTGAGLVYIKSGAPAHTPSTDEDAWMVLDTTNNALYYWDETAGDWENILDDFTRDTVFRITNVPDTALLVPLQGDIFINAAGDTMGVYSTKWQLFFGGNELTGSGTTNNIALWNSATELTDSWLSQSGSRLSIASSKVLNLGGIATASLPAATAGDVYYNITENRPYWTDGLTRYTFSPWTRITNGISYTNSTRTLTVDNLSFLYNTTGSTTNTHLGYNASYSFSSTGGTFIGTNTGVSAGAGQRPTAVGGFALSSVTTITRCTGVGYNAGLLAGGNESVYVGHNSGLAASGIRGVYIGHEAGQSSPATYGINIGYRAGYNNSSSERFHAVGYVAAQNNTGNNVYASGYGAGSTNSGDNVTMAGNNAGNKNSGDNLTAVGNFTALANKGNNASFIGYLSGYQNTGSFVSGFGQESLYGNSTDSLTAIGYRTGYFQEDVTKRDTFTMSDRTVDTVKIWNSTSIWGEVGDIVTLLPNPGVSDFNYSRILQWKILTDSTLYALEPLGGTPDGDIVTLTLGLNYNNTTMVGAFAQATKSNQVVIGNDAVEQIKLGPVLFNSSQTLTGRDGEVWTYNEVSGESELQPTAESLYQNATYYEETERQYTLTITGADTIITVDTMSLALATDSISMSSGLIENLKSDTVRWQVRYDFYYLSDEDACFALLDLTTDGTETPAAIPGSAARGEQVSLNGGQMPGRTCLVDVPPGQKIRLCVKGNVGVATSMDISFLTITINEINRE